jgi:starch-binding outer membrane protein, SusD/RagB family
MLQASILEFKTLSFMNHKNILLKSMAMLLVVAISVFSNGCTEDLLEQNPKGELNSNQFWKTEADASIGLMGAYSAVRAVFDRDYYFDGHGDFVRVRGNAAVENSVNQGGPYFIGNRFGLASGGFAPVGYGQEFDTYWRYLYGAVVRTNYVIENTKILLASARSESSRTNLESIIGEARFLRGMVYFRLISLWGDVPYFQNVITDVSEEPLFSQLSRTPLAVVKDSILSDFTYAFEKLPVKRPAAGRASKPAALAFRGKMQLYWACWNKFGWPELSTFTPDLALATAAYGAAVIDFNAVINNYGLSLFRGGNPGQIDVLGKADILPNYFYLFMPAANDDSEMIMSFNHGTTGTRQGEELMRDFAGRSVEFSQHWVMPRYEIANRYQLTTTGDFAPNLIPMNPNTNAAARTTLNSAVNPQSYVDRDYRMKASIMWDYEMILGLNALRSTGMVPFIFTKWNAKEVIGGIEFTTYNTDANPPGYTFRKFVRNYAGQGRSDGDFSWPVMRLADVFLMYAEAANETNGPQADAIDLVNRVRARGNLPVLAPANTADYDAFFAAIEQERIIELVGEGHRGFDLRRWRALKRVWENGGAGVQTIDTHNANREIFYRNAVELTYQQSYIFRIPPGERDRNPNLTQNTPWL